MLVLSGWAWAFLWLWQAGATLQCSVRASHCSGSSCCGAEALGCVGSGDEAPRLYSTGSIVVEQGLVALQHVGIFPDQEPNVCLLHCWGDSLSLSHQGSPSKPSFLRVHGCELSHFSCVQLFASLWTVVHQALLSMQISPGKNTGVGCHALLQGIFSTRDQTQVSCVSCITGRFFITEPPGKPPLSHHF